ncbi:OmpW family outer membrane protein [uncultured Rhodoblastus sp.]|uniref:OmpW/AlkL family protein n=1 Tax=uncultured Rhodoblastus sp. TaxID=543037 RepID=UPI0025DE4F8D|nr:OmpW family outer membrane protein [uncultured Rhodoblastus sp.]
MRFHLSFNKWGAAGVLSLIAASCGAVGSSASAADLPSVKEPIAVAPAADDFQPFFVKIGVTYAINTSTSQLWGQNPALYRFGAVQAFPAGVGATIGNITTIGFESGYFVTRNISIDVSGGIPFYAKDSTKGFNPRNPTVPNGTVLSQIMPAVVPITVLYHFDNFGPVRPYLGGGFAPGFSFNNKNAFLNNVSVGGAVGWVLQAGAEYMIDKHWGLSIDAKKIFSYVEARGTSINLPGVGAVPAVVVQHTHFDPWLLSVGFVYRFGLPDAVVAKY